MKIDHQDMHNIIKSSVRESLEKNGAIQPKVEKKPTILESVRKSLKETFILTPKSFMLKTEFLSSKAKEAHEKLYNDYVKVFDKLAVKVSSVNTEEANSNGSDFRSYKIDEQYNLNAVKLHELYFYNISQIDSTIASDSVPYMRLNRDFGTFERWQYDFRACAMSSREGWAVCYWEPYRNVYMNAVIDGHTVGVPMGCVPVIVLDLWAHSYYRDYLDDKKSYVNAMMKELNWNVIEARMVIAERSRVGDIYEIKTIVNTIPQKMLSNIEQSQVPIGKDKIETNDIINTNIDKEIV